MNRMSGIGYEIKRKRIKRIPVLLVVVSMFIIPLLTMGSATADGGMISFHEFSVYEPGQKAIIAWDGSEEIMILSVDVYSEKSTKALHMVPFPTLPEVELGTVESFKQIEQIMYTYERYGSDNSYGNDSEVVAPSGGNIEIVFQEQIGAHDITAVEIKSPLDFTNWVKDFLEGKGITNRKLPNELDIVVGHYTEQYIRHFVFDVIDLQPNEKSVDPIIYKFKSNYLFFPLEISSIIEGSTEITLALITPTNVPMNSNALRDLGFDRDYDEIIAQTELNEVNKDIANMFEDKCRLSLYEGYFELKDLEDDVVIRRLSNVNWMHTEMNRLKSYQVSDLDNDGKHEVNIVTNNKLKIFDAAKGDMEHECEVSKDYKYATVPVQPIDINKDGIADVIATRWENSFFYIYMLNGANGNELWECKTEGKVGYYTYSIAEDPGINGAIKIITYVSDTIYAINGHTGDLLWSQTFDREELGYIYKLAAGDVNGDGVADVITHNGHRFLVALNGKNGVELWRTETNDRVSQLEIADIANKTGMEVIYQTNDAVYALNGQTGNKLWSITEDELWSGYLNLFTLYDWDNDYKLEVIISSQSYVAIVDGSSGEQIMELGFNYPSYKQNYLTNLALADLDSDGDPELIGQAIERLYVIDLKNGTLLWEFTTGDLISSYEVEDIDNDGNNEILVVTGNSMYTVEYTQAELESSGGAASSSDEIIILGSILIPIIILVIIIIGIVKIIDYRGTK